MLSYQYNNSHYKDKMVSQLSHLYTEILYLERSPSYWDKTPSVMNQSAECEVVYQTLWNPMKLQFHNKIKFIFPLSFPCSSKHRLKLDDIIQFHISGPNDWLCVRKWGTVDVELSGNDTNNARIGSFKSKLVITVEDKSLSQSNSIFNLLICKD